ncbi:hypothetical protein [Jiangella asiatica]|uniref:hypothetical protein n=1 Tax=Jiangella asiatica TaxID=2530372 RepID=UPI0013A5EB8C|nr:hypothetical protein [Jiangella asiatica]
MSTAHHLLADDTPAARPERAGQATVVLRGDLGVTADDLRGLPYQLDLTDRALRLLPTA